MHCFNIGYMPKTVNLLFLCLSHSTGSKSIFLIGSKNKEFATIWNVAMSLISDALLYQLQAHSKNLAKRNFQIDQKTTNLPCNGAKRGLEPHFPSFGVKFLKFQLLVMAFYIM